MKHLPYLKELQKTAPKGEYCGNELIRFRSYRETYGESALMAGALAQKAWFENYPVYVYEYDRIAGSRHGNYVELCDGMRSERTEKGTSDPRLIRKYFFLE